MDKIGDKKILDVNVYLIQREKILYTLIDFIEVDK